VSRLPIRLRVAGAFAVALAVVLAGMGAFLYVRLGADLRSAIDRELRLRADDVAALVRSPGGSLSGSRGAGLVERGESFAQLLAADGTLLDATPTVGGLALLSPAEVSGALRGSRFLDRPSVPGLDEPARLLAAPVDRGGATAVIAVGASTEDRAEALADLRNALLLVGPIALLLATGAGYVLAGSGLRAVEAMRRRAAEISAARPGERLPVPPTRDELESLGRTLNEMLGRLELAIERERGFVADAGHELRTPLTLLRAELDVALRHAAGEEELRAAVRQASDETDRLVQLASDLLLIASTGEGKLPLRVEPVQVAELFESVRNRFLWRASDAGRPIVLDVAVGTALPGDRLRLEQAAGNLVDNALRHGAGAVVLAAAEEADQVVLSVTDRGRGFPPAYLPRAFERFSRPDEGRTGSGTGLGLAIVDTIARAHGGSALAENVPGVGARVTLRLPADG
jgi:two-component system, OmpR family, sensor kinase